MHRRLVVPGVPCFSRSVHSVANKPVKGIRGKSHVPGQLKDHFNYFGFDGSNGVGDAPHMPEGQRTSMINEIMGDGKSKFGMDKVDRLALGMRAASDKEPNHSEWMSLMTLFRTSEMAVELVPHESDMRPPGDKLWIDLNISTERRRPYVFELEDGTVVLPAFSWENRTVSYFSKAEAFECCYFPHPKTGTQKEEYDKQEQPVMATGRFQKLAMLATVSVKGLKCVILVNPFDEFSKILTYQEMLHIAKAKDKSGNIAECSESLFRIFDTTTWTGRRVDPVQLVAERERKAKGSQMSQPVASAEKPWTAPELARLELRQLIFDKKHVESVWVTSEATAKWKQWLTKAPSKRILVTVVLREDEGKLSVVQEEVRARLNTWSALREVEGDFEIVFAPEPTGEEAARHQCIYRHEQGALLRRSAYRTGPSLRETLNYDDPLSVDAHYEAERKKASSRSPTPFDRMRREDDGRKVGLD